ncbi:trigger factor [Chloroflexota bacterium]
MKVTNEKTEDSQAFLTIEVEPEEMEESMESAYKRLVKKAKIPGFRVGKAPRSVLERYLGKESLLEEALNNMVPEVYEKAIKEQEIAAIAQPQIEITQTDPVIFKAIVPLKPTVKLGDYRSIKLKPETVKVTKSNVDAVIEQLRHQNATWEPVDRAVDYNDLVVMDIESSVEGEPYINQKGAQFQILHDQSFPAPEFAGQLIGMKSGEEKEFKLKLAPNPAEKEAEVKEASFKVKTSEIKQEILPELNDEFAKTVSAEFETIKALRERATSDMKAKAEEMARLNFEEKVLDALVDLGEIEFPPVLVELEIDRIINQRFQGSNQSLDDYLASIGKTEEEIREELKPMAATRVNRSLVLGNVAEENNIEVNDSEIDEEINNITRDATENKDEMKKFLNQPQFRESIEQTLLSRKTMKLLTDIAHSPKEPKKTKRAKKEEENE